MVICFILAEFKVNNSCRLMVMGILLADFESSAMCIVKCKLSLLNPSLLIDCISAKLMSKERVSSSKSVAFDTPKTKEEDIFSVKRDMSRIFVETNEPAP